MARLTNDYELAELKRNYIRGIRTVTYGGRTITYSLEEMAEIIASEESQMAGSASTRVNFTLARFCRAG